MEDKILTGNVFKDYSGSILIIYKTDDSGVHWIPLSSSNISGFTPWKTSEKTVTCNCVLLHDDSYGPDENCDCCNGTGIENITAYGMDRAQKLAYNVKHYILKNLTQNFDF